MSYVEFDDVTKRFGKTTALESVDLTIAEGERVGLVGPNGSGKTTLIRLLTGLARGVGRVRVGGADPFAERERLDGEVGYVPQIAPETEMTVREFSRLVAGSRGLAVEAIYEVCRQLGFGPAGHLAKPYRALSGGMKQKLLVAMTLADRPSLLVMDEPTASLDADARRTFFEQCTRVADEATLVLCSHRLEEIRHLVDRIVALEQGRVVADGPIARFVNRQGRTSIEVQLDGSDDEIDAWLLERGFEPVSPGRYAGFFATGEKMDRVRELHERLGAQMEDLVVHDLSDLQVTSEQGAER